MNTCNWRIVFLPIVQIGNTLVVCAAYYKGIASAAFIIRERKHIEVLLKLILVEIDVVGEIG